jgi:HPt (histidine-containing phosphotransfer) domain-containing protein
MDQLISEELIYRQFGEDDQEMIREIIQLILSTNIKDLKELGVLYEIGDFHTIKHRCHKSKPSMSYLGAFAVKQTLEQIEADVENFHDSNVLLQLQLKTLEAELNNFLLKLN